MLRLRLLSVMCVLFSASLIWAQPPGGGRTGGGDGVDVPDIDEIELDVQSDIDIDIRSEEIRATASAIDATTLVETPFDPTQFNEMMDSYTVPDDWSEIQFTSDMPSREDILAMQSDLPHTLDLDSLDIGLASSDVATSAIVGYARSMLGLTVTPLYAEEYGDVEIENSQIAQETLDMIYSQIPADMQAFLTQADSLSGVAYWAILDDGLALLYTGDCEVEQCTINQQSVQVEITNGSAGIYAIYSDMTPSSTDEAKALIQSTFPYLATLDLSETESAYGTVFFAFDIDVESSQVTAYYAGVYEVEGQSIVYVLSGIGDAYVNVLLGG